jgi:hypothetical protein
MILSGFGTLRKIGSFAQRPTVLEYISIVQLAVTREVNPSKEIKEQLKSGSSPES